MLGLFALLVILWIFGVLGNIGGGLIHLLLVIALIVLVFRILNNPQG